MGVFGPSIRKMTKRRDIAGLCTAIRHRRLGVRSRAVEALSELRDPSAIDDLIIALKEGYVEAAPAIAAIGDASVVPRLVEMVRDYEVGGTYGTRYAALALAQLGEVAVAELLMLLESDNLGVVRDVQDAFVRAHAQAVDALIAVARDGHQPQRIRDHAIATLRQIGTADAMDGVGNVLYRKEQAVAQELQAKARAEAKRAYAQCRERLATFLADDEVSTTEAGLLLADFYDATILDFHDATPREAGYFADSAEEVRAIGRKLNEHGGMNEMLETLRALERLRTPRAANNLSRVWDGIGTWTG